MFCRASILILLSAYFASACSSRPVSGSNPDIRAGDDAAVDGADASETSETGSPIEMIRQYENQGLDYLCECLEPDEPRQTACLVRLRAHWAVEPCQLEIPEANQESIQRVMLPCMAQAAQDLAACMQDDARSCRGSVINRCLNRYIDDRTTCYYLVYDVRESQSEYLSWFEALEECRAAAFPGGLSCAEEVAAGMASQEVSENSADPVFSGRLAQAGANLLQPTSCIVDGYETALEYEPDVLHLWRAPSTGMFRFTVGNAEADGQLWVTEGCDAPSLGCSDYPDSIESSPTLTLNATEGTTYLVIFKASVEVDAAYQIFIERVTP